MIEQDETPVGSQAESSGGGELGQHALVVEDGEGAGASGVVDEEEEEPDTLE